MELYPVIDVMLAFQEVKDNTFGWDLKEGWAASIKTYTQMFSELQVYSKNILKLPLSVTWKIHCITCHLEAFLLEVSAVQYNAKKNSVSCLTFHSGSVWPGLLC